MNEIAYHISSADICRMLIRIIFLSGWIKRKFHKRNEALTTASRKLKERKQLVVYLEKYMSINVNIYQLIFCSLMAYI